MGVYRRYLVANHGIGSLGACVVDCRCDKSWRWLGDGRNWLFSYVCPQSRAGRLFGNRYWLGRSSASGKPRFNISERRRRRFDFGILFFAHLFWRRLLERGPQPARSRWSAIPHFVYDSKMEIFQPRLNSSLSEPNRQESTGQSDASLRNFAYRLNGEISRLLSEKIDWCNRSATDWIFPHHGAGNTRR